MAESMTEKIVARARFVANQNQNEKEYSYLRTHCRHNRFRSDAVFGQLPQP